MRRSLPASPGSLRVQCPWQRESMYPSARNPIPSTPILPGRKASLRATLSTRKEELAQVYVARGVEIGLARQVALQLMAKDALGAHARDELGISETTTARPVQAALASAATFTVGAAAPLAACADLAVNSFAARGRRRIVVVFGTSRNDRRQSRRSRNPQANNPRDVLGCPSRWR